MLDLEEYYQTQHLIDEINAKREQADYDKHLASLSIEDDYEEIQMTLQLLSQIDFDKIRPYEEELALRILESNNLQLQSEALNALGCWEKTTQLERVKKVKIANRYLQEDLEEFIAEMEKK